MPRDDKPSHHDIDSVVKVCETSRVHFYAPVEHDEDNKLGHQGDILRDNNCVRTPDKFLYEERCHIAKGIFAADQNDSESDFSNTCVQCKHGQSLQPFEIYALCDNLKTGVGNALVDTGSKYR
jgi:hypothetical protein